VERLMGGEKAQALITDPPFAVRDDDWDKFKNKETFAEFTGLWLSNGYFHADIVACFFADKWIPLLLEVAEKGGVPYRRALLWHKPAGSQFAGASLDGYWFNFEIIEVFGKPSFNPSKQTRMAVFEYRTITGQEHGCEKPVELLSDIVGGYSQRGKTVLDLFGGSGSTLIACEKLDRRCYMMEIDPHYCDVIIERWQNYTGKKAVRIDG